MDDGEADTIVQGQDEQDDGEGIGVIAGIGKLPAGALVTEEGLAAMCGRCTASIRRAVDRGELPPPVRLMGKPTWTAGSIVRHMEYRLDLAAREREKLKSQIARLAS